MRKFLHSDGLSSVEVDKYGIHFSDGDNSSIYIGCNPLSEEERDQQLKTLCILREAIEEAEANCMKKDLSKKKENN